MIGRFFAAIILIWLVGFLWFAVALPEPAGTETTDAIVVPTGGAGRIDRGLELLRDGRAKALLVSGVDIHVRPHEFAVQYDVSDRLMRCCITLGFDALDTRGNARETALWLEKNDYRSIRLVTSDWHMRRIVQELNQALPDNIEVLEDGVRTRPSLRMLFLEYNKFLLTFLSEAWPG
ncbi:YdcF family protein [Altericroceibacterium spongiae]|uniref:YdcF family protein n=1 Tax=Altericroceibacterium spongiae TaxID=2320269 RepID=UPI001EE5020F|nr:YdcF family protein [Altericroceibacterium spongiae]